MIVALAQINPIIGDLEYNSKKIIEAIQKGKREGAQIVVFPEMAICGYPPEDLLLLPSFVAACEEALQNIVAVTQGITAIVGCVRTNPAGEKKRFNSAAIIQEGKLLGFSDKMLLPDYDVFSERRYFDPAETVRVWDIAGKKVGITICEDIWQHSGAASEYVSYSHDPIEELKKEKIDLLINLSASPYYIRRAETRFEVCKTTSLALKCPTLFCNQVGANDGLIFDGFSLCVAPDGTIFNYGKSFEEDFLRVDLTQGFHQKLIRSDPIEDLFKALVLGVRDYFHKSGLKKACFGLSGGIDSAVVAAIAKEALGKENIVSFALPSRYSSEESFSDADTIAKNLDIQLETLSIEGPFQAFLETLAPQFKDQPVDVTEENLQARIRGALLMAFSNKFGYLVLCTSNKSEMGVGFSTLYGDMCGALCVLSDVIKEQVYTLARYINREKEIIPESVMTKAPTAELRFHQKDTDSLPEYSVLDRVLQGYVEEHLSIEEVADQYEIPLPLVKELVRKIHLNEYKRRQAPLGLRVTKKAFTVGRRFPIVQHWNIK